MQWVLDVKGGMLLLNITVVALSDFPFSLYPHVQPQDIPSMCHSTIYSLYLFCQIKGIIVSRAIFGLNPRFVLRTPCAFVFASRCQSGMIASQHIPILCILRDLDFDV